MKTHVVKAKETLGRIANKYRVTVAQIMAVNPQITDKDKIGVGQIISIPESVSVAPLDETPPADSFAMPVSRVLERARSALGKKIRYELGAGGMFPNSASPANINHLCDCSGYVSWCYGVSRKTDHPLYKKFNGGWINTDAMANDAKKETGFFRLLNSPRVGCIIVFPGPPLRKIGHVGIVTEVNAAGTAVTKVIHCSLGNDRKFKDSVQETAPDVFKQPDTIFGWYEGLDD